MAVVTGSNGGGVSPLAIVHKDSTCTHGGFTHCNLPRWCFSFHAMAQILNLRSGNLHCVVVILISISAYRYTYVTVRWLYVVYIKLVYD